MKYLLMLTIASLLLLRGAVAQNFEYLYNKKVESCIVDGVETDSSYILVGFDEKYPSYKPLFLRISKSGQFIADSTASSMPSSFNSGLLEYNGNYLLVQSYFIGSTTEQIKVTKLDEEFDPIGTSHVFFDSINYSVQKTKLLSDSELVMVGMSLDSQSRGNDAFALFLNLNSGKQKFLNMGNSNPIELTTDVLKIGEKYYFFKIKSTSTLSTCNTSTEIKRYNADLSLDTTVAICNSMVKGNGNHFNFIVSAIKLSDSSFMMSARTHDGNFWGIGDDLGILVWDSNFVEMNSSMFGIKDSMAIEGNKSISRYKNNPNVYVGGTERYIVNPSGYDTSTSFFALSRVDLSGNLLWTRYYSNNSYLLMYKVLATSDGGAMMIGTSYDDQNNNLEKDVWIVKVDSNGSFQNSSSIAEMGSIHENEYLFYPNPFEDRLHFRQINVEREYSLQIFDLTGRKVLEQGIDQSDEVIDVSNLAAGGYLYFLADKKNGNYASGKLVKK